MNSKQDLRRVDEVCATALESDAKAMPPSFSERADEILKHAANVRELSQTREESSLSDQVQALKIRTYSLLERIGNYRTANFAHASDIEEARDIIRALDIDEGRGVVSRPEWERTRDAFQGQVKR